MKPDTTFQNHSKGPVDLLIIAGEHSGDEHAARMIRELLKEKPNTKVCALGGENLKAEGAELLFDLTEHSVVGIVEVLKNYSFFKSIFDQTIEWVKEHKPKAICFVDYPGLNLRLAAKLHELALSKKAGGDISLAFYISPQIWAWKQKRRFKMEKYLDGVGVIFPFEVPCYADTSLDAQFVGHPYLEDDYENNLIFDAEAPILLVPGSRVQPVKRILPKMLDGVARFFAKEKWDVQIPCPSETIKNVLIACIKETYPERIDQIQIVSAEDTIKASSVLTSSGTMSLQCALAGLPGAIAYVTHPLTFAIAKRIVKVPYLGMSNILLPENRMYNEYWQENTNSENLAKELENSKKPENIKKAREVSEELKKILSPQNELTPHKWLQRFL